jgi:hypothetical protein
MTEQPDDRYLRQFRGSFTSAMRWPDLDTLWQTLRRSPDNWFVYAVGHPPPKQTLSAEEFERFLEEIDRLLRAEHDEDYCGIVYADNLRAPSMVKIYDPNNLGVSCGYSDNPPLPGWVLSHVPPVALQSQQPLPGNRRRWWQRLFSL